MVLVRSLRLAALFAAAISILGSAAGADGCADLTPQGDGRVAAVVDARSIRLDDGREIRLAGIEPIAAHKADAIAALQAIAVGRDVILRGADDAPDRYGRQPALAYPGTDRELLQPPLQQRLIAQGLGLVAPDNLTASCRAELLAVEAEARRLRQGGWTDPGLIASAADPDALLTRIGQFTLVEGRVASVREAGATVYLNFGRRWTNGFAVTISRRIVGTFEAAAIGPKTLEGRRIRVRGWVEKRGGPRIEIRDVGQLELPGGG